MTTRRGPRPLVAVGPVLAVGAVALCVVLAAACGGPVELRGSLWDPPEPAPELVLTDQHGDVFDLAEHRGQVVLVFFGFVQCPDVCPLTLSTWKRLEASLGDDADRVEFVFVTVDPERDDAGRIGRHLAIFSERTIGLSGSLDELEPIYEAWHVYRRRRAIGTGESAYLMDHTSRIFVVDPRGEIRMTHDFDTPIQDLEHDVRALLRGA